MCVCAHPFVWRKRVSNMKDSYRIIPLHTEFSHGDVRILLSPIRMILMEVTSCSHPNTKLIKTQDF